MKKGFALCLALCIALCACAKETPPAPKESKTLSVVATLFPQYDFAREIAGERAEVTLLLPAGVESHSFEPSPSDVVRIHNCDLFLYTGPEMEPWAQTMLSGGLPDSVRVVNLSEEIEMTETKEAVPGEEHEESEEGHHHVVDPHVWTSPANAAVMVGEIADALCTADPEGESTYRANAEAYLAKLTALDEELFSIVEGAERREIVFGSRYAFHYFTERYGLTAYAAYDSCSEEGEPSVGVLTALADRIREDKIPVIYYEELTDPKIARALAEETGAEMLLLHSCHNLSKDEMKRGETYLSLMRQNAENLKAGLY